MPARRSEPDPPVCESEPLLACSVFVVAGGRGGTGGAAAGAGGVVGEAVGGEGWGWEGGSAWEEGRTWEWGGGDGYLRAPYTYLDECPRPVLQEEVVWRCCKVLEWLGVRIES